MINPQQISQNIKASQLPSTVILFLLAAPFVIVYYASYVFNPANAQNIFLYVMQLIADSIAIMVMMSLWLTILLDVLVEDHHRLIQPQDQNFLKKREPTIDVFVTVAGEPIEIVKKTIIAAAEMEYPHHTFVLDDGKSRLVKALCQKLNIHYVTRENKNFAKSGNLNNGLRESKGEFFAVFDADQVPQGDFITKLLPYMADEQIALVQSPQSFGNIHDFIASGTAQAQDVFYRYICPAKNISNSVFCVGTNMIFRRSAIDEIGGIYQLSHSEDIWTSRFLHEKGWKSVFVNLVLAKGTAPSTIASYFKQQQRWANGGLSMLFFANPLNSHRLTIDQRLQYFFANAFYLVGFSMLVYLILPIAYLFFGISPIHVGNNAVWLSHYLPYFLLYYSLTWLLLGKIKLSTISTSLASFYPYCLAFISTVFGTKVSWVPTTSQHARYTVAMKWIWPHVLFILLTILSLIVGWFEPSDTTNTFINSVWASWNMYLLIAFIFAERSHITEKVTL